MKNYAEKQRAARLKERTGKSEIVKKLEDAL